MKKILAMLFFGMFLSASSAFATTVYLTGSVDSLNGYETANTGITLDSTVSLEALSIVGASAALSVSNIPFNGPIGAALVCEVDGQLVINPSLEDQSRSTLELVVAGTQDAILMIEAGSSFVSEERILEAIQLGHESIKETVQLQSSLVQQVNPVKQEVPVVKVDEALNAEIKSFVGTKIRDNMTSGQKSEIDTFLTDLKKSVMEQFVTEDSDNQAEVSRLYEAFKKDEIRQSIIQQKVRPDGRALDEIRPISVQLSTLPSAHGSAVFTRGETQSLGVITLGTNMDEQIEDGLNETVRHRYYFHYNFPPYSVGETGFMGRTGRRELGHGALAQRALLPVLPDSDAFPYTLRIVSEILESNGSSSMASVCSGALSMMDGGVPIKAPVSGIAMGLLLDGDDFAVLSDIQGLEDHYGDMDFKVAGTQDGITALQLDIKVSGLSEAILRQALEQAKKGRLHILDEMDKAITEPRGTLSPNAPKIHFMKINPEKVGLLIGPGGKNIRNIEEESGATVFVADGSTGEVTISCVNQDAMDKALEMVNNLVRDLEIGDTFDGKVVKIVNFGAFLELGKTGKEALLHISKVADHRIDSVEEYLKMGQCVPVKIDAIDDNGRVSLVRAD